MVKTIFLLTKEFFSKIGLILYGDKMGRKTACSADEWHQIPKEGARDLARELRKKLGGKIGMETWKQYYARFLREAASLAVEDCDVQRIVNEAIRKVLGS